MPQRKRPLFSDEFLDELAEEISDMFSGTDKNKKGETDSLDMEENQKKLPEFQQFFHQRFILQQE